MAVKGYKPEVRLFSLDFESCREEMVRHYGGYIRCFLGKFCIQTDNPDILRFIYQCGSVSGPVRVSDTLRCKL